MAGPLDLSAAQRMLVGQDTLLRVADFATAVSAEAALGDPVATRICADAGHALAVTAQTALQAVPSAPTRVSWAGRLLVHDGPILRSMLTQLDDLGAHATPPHHSPLGGAWRLADPDSTQQYSGLLTQVTAAASMTDTQERAR